MLLGSAASWDNGLHWADPGEIIRLNQAYMPGLTFSEIGDDPLVPSPAGFTRRCWRLSARLLLRFLPT